MNESNVTSEKWNEFLKENADIDTSSMEWDCFVKQMCQQLRVVPQTFIEKDEIHDDGSRKVGSWKCHHCHKSVSPFDNYCKHCGYAFDSDNLKKI